MESVLLTLALLSCPVGMGLMMWWMGRAHRQSSAQPSSPDELQAEHARLTEEIAELERQQRPEPAAAVRS